jgi:regulator of RNase E activity RraA
MGEPIDIGGVTINSGDYVLADIDGVVIIPQDIAEAVVAETEAVASTETAMRDAILGGMDPVDAYKKFDTF